MPTAGKHRGGVLLLPGGKPENTARSHPLQLANHRIEWLACSLRHRPAKRSPTVAAGSIRVKLSPSSRPRFSHSDIDMAKGALIALHGCEPGEAFTRLVEESQRHNIKLREVALELLDRMKSAS
jgi:hypothetical protein